MIDTCKSQLLGLYYLATLPQRRWATLDRTRQKTVPAMVLFYHRVADSHPNGWTISTVRFRRQIAWLRERFDIVSLEELQRRIAAGVNDRPTACITFDDGYADNCRIALPWLMDEKIPFTYFVSTLHMQLGKPFSHDIAAGRPLPPNSIEQIQELAAAGVELGAHTRTHADLGKLQSQQQLRDEIVGSKEDLEAILGQPVRYFAFPFGLPENMSTAAFRIAYQAGFQGVCSAYGGYNHPGDDPFHIRRIHGDPQWSRFCNWLTIDPRKLNEGLQFKPGEYRNSEQGTGFRALAPSP